MDIATKKLCNSIMFYCYVLYVSKNYLLMCALTLVLN